MKPYRIILILAALLPAPVAAQVQVNPAALAQLAGVAPTSPKPAPRPKPAPPVKHVWHEVRRPMRVVEPAPLRHSPLKPTPIKPAPASAVPPAPALGAVQAPRPVAPPPALVVAFAPGSASPPAGIGAALKPFCESQGVITIDARAPADPNDPSLAMRLSLARAMALRDALTSCGVASQNILPRALGSVPGMNEDQAVLGVQK